MKLRDLLKVYNDKLRLVDSRYGKTVATAYSSYSKYADITVLHIATKIKTNGDEDLANTYLWVILSYTELEAMKGD